MPGWKEFRSSVARFAEKAAATTGELADTAALRLRLAGARNELEEAYEALGRLLYPRLRSGDGNTEQIEEALTVIDKLIAEIQTLEAQLTARTRSHTETNGETSEKEPEGAAETAETAEIQEAKETSDET